MSGPGSRWTLTSDLAIGGTTSTAGGTGSLTVAAGGSVAVGGLTKVWPNGTLHLVGGSVTTKTLDVATGTFNFTGGTG